MITIFDKKGNKEEKIKDQGVYFYFMCDCIVCNVWPLIADALLLRKNKIKLFRNQSEYIDNQPSGQGEIPDRR